MANQIPNKSVSMEVRSEIYLEEEKYNRRIDVIAKYEKSFKQLKETQESGKNR